MDSSNVRFTDLKDEFVLEVREKESRDNERKSSMRKAEDNPRPDGPSDSPEEASGVSTSGAGAVIFTLGSHRLQQITKHKVPICIGFGLLIVVFVVVPINVCLYVIYT